MFEIHKIKQLEDKIRRLKEDVKYLDDIVDDLSTKNKGLENRIFELEFDKKNIELKNWYIGT